MRPYPICVVISGLDAVDSPPIPLISESQLVTVFPNLKFAVLRNCHTDHVTPVDAEYLDGTCLDGVSFVRVACAACAA
jgi:hypothetical protein